MNLQSGAWALRTSCMAVAAVLLLAASVRAQAPLHIHIISGANEYESGASLKEYKRYLEDRYDVEITASWVEDGAQHLPGVEHVPDADLLLVFARRLKLADDEMGVLQCHWEQGKSIVGIRTASHAFRRSTNQVFDHDVLGGNYQGHFGDHPVQVNNVAEDHPVLDAVQPFTSRKLYKAGELAGDATVLQTGATQVDGGRHTHPVTWTHHYRGGRTVYTSLGVPEDFEHPSFRRLITNAIFWAAEREQPAQRADR